MICIKCHKDVPDGPFCCQCGAKQEQGPSTRTRGNHAGAVEKRGKTWSVRVTVGGYVGSDGKYHQRRISKGGFRTKADASAYIPTLLAEQDKPETFQVLKEAYTDGGYKSLSDSKKVAYTIALRRWEPIMGREVSTMTMAELQKVMDTAVSTYYPAHDMQSVLSHMYKIAMADQQATVNMARLLTLPPLEEREPVAFSEIEIHKIWEAYGAGSLIYGYILLMMYTGMMPGELMRLRADMVDFDRREIIGVGLKTDRRKTAPIVIPAQLIPVVEYLLEHHSRGGKVVIWGPDRFYKEYHAALAAAGVRDLPPYSCRHTTATALALGDIAPSIIQRIMRHSKLSSTQRYIHMSDKESHEAADSVLTSADA